MKGIVMRKFFCLMLAVCASLGIPWGCFAATTQVDALIEKLVEKSILTKSEALKLKGEIAADEKLHREESIPQVLPEWVRNTKIKGDFRLRYQYERKASDTDSRLRGRIRYRLGLESQVIEKVKVGAGLASGGDDPRSTNSTFQDTFERGDVRLDYAFAEFKPIKGIDMIGGIFPKSNYLWTPDDLLWDTDINPTGGAVHLERSFTDSVTGFMNSGVLLLDESASSDKPDPFMHYSQGGVKIKDSNSRYEATAAGIYYGFNAVKQTNLDWCSGTNTGRTSGASSSGACTGAPSFDFDSLGASAEAGVKQLFGGLPLDIDKWIAFFGDYIHNVDPKDDANGWAAGAKFGHKKVDGKGQWQAKYQRSYLGKDAWLDTFPDSDRLGGRTDAYGHEAILEYGLHKNVVLGLDYYQDQRIKGSKDLSHLLQADLVVKF
jgi:hypothetical protein